MRVTQHMIFQSAVRGLNRNLEALRRANEEVATGRRVQRPSDDPVNASVIMRLDSQIRGLDRFRRAGTEAASRLATEEVVLSSVDDFLRQAKAISTGMSEDVNDPLRQAALNEVINLRRQVISLANTQLGGEYIFAGSRSDAPAFLPDGTYQGDTAARELEVGEGMRVTVTHTGDQFLAGAIDALDRLATELAGGTAADIRSAVDDLNTAHDEVKLAVGRNGSRSRQVQDIQKHFVRNSLHLFEQKQELQDADPTESAVKLRAAQNALEQAYASLSRVLSTNILDFLR